MASFLQEGFASFTIDRAAKRFHCPKSTSYSLGTTRDEIIRRVLVSFFREVARITDAAVNRRQSNRAALESYCSAITTALEPASPEFMRDVAAEKVTAIIEAGCQAEELRPAPTDFLAEIIHAAMERIQQGE